MDFFDQRILHVLKDGRRRSFNAILGEVGFSHNTLQQHLKRLAHDWQKIPVFWLVFVGFGRIFVETASSPSASYGRVAFRLAITFSGCLAYGFNYLFGL